MAYTTFKELDIVKYIDPEKLETNKPEYGTKLADMYGIVRDAYKDKVYVEFIKKNNKTLDICTRPVEELERVGTLYDLVHKGLTPIIIKEPRAPKEPKEKKERKPRATKKVASTSIPSGTGKLNGLRILPTGLFDNFSRSSFVESINNNGGIYGSGGVNKKLDILVVGRAAGPAKLERAKELGIRMIDEQTYLDMLK